MAKDCYVFKVSIEYTKEKFKDEKGYSSFLIENFYMDHAIDIAQKAFRDFSKGDFIMITFNIECLGKIANDVIN